MPHPGLLSSAAASSGFLLVLALVVPVAGVQLAFVAGGRWVQRVALATVLIGLGIVVAIAAALLQTGTPLVYDLGAWAPPLGVALRADGLSAVMLVTAAVVIGAVAVYARADFPSATASREARAPFAFWILLLGVWGALNAVFLSGDLFTLYVALELLTFAGVPLVCLDGHADTLQSALRYLIFALLGSILYLVGTVLLYGAYGTLDIVLLANLARSDAATMTAVTLMTVGLLAKTALFPLHLWLPPAHAGAPAAASAVLSALVVKGSFFIVVRLWFQVMPAVPGHAAAQLLTALGAGAILLGSVVALRQQRLKLLIAYSTLAQIGYLFLMFALAYDPAVAQLASGRALAGGVLQAISHATAKAAMFMAAGLIYTTLGHDRIAGLQGIARARPLCVLAFGLGGLALMGMPPSGAYVAKELLLSAADHTGQWWWAAVLQSGAFFTAGYLILVLTHAFSAAEMAPAVRGPVARGQELAALGLALCSLSLGLVPWEAWLPLPPGSVSSPLATAAFAKALWPLLGGAVVAILLGRWGDGLPRFLSRGVFVVILTPTRRATFALGGWVERADGVLRGWTAASLSLLLLVVLFGAAVASGGRLP